MKLKRSHSKATLMQNGEWAYHAMGALNNIEDDYFDEIVQDVIDPEKYNHEPMASGIGTKFTLFMGDLKSAYAVGEFRVDGVKSKTDQNGIKTHHLLWTQLGDWSFVNLDGKSKKAA